MWEGTQNYIWIDCSSDIEAMFLYLDKIQTEHHEQFGPILDMVKREIDELFDDDRIVVYIPAGRKSDHAFEYAVELSVQFYG